MIKNLKPLVAIVAMAVCFSVRAQSVFFGNLHSHTSYSDGSATPEDAYLHARDMAQVDFLAITEHNHRRAPSQLETNPGLYNGPQGTSLISAARHFTVDNEFVAIYGQEFSTIGSGNHANILEIGEVILPAQVPNGRWNELITWLATHPDSQNEPAIVLLNHPCIAGSPDNVEYGRDDFPNLDAWRTALDPHVCLMNIINGPSHKDTGESGTPCEREFLRYLNMGLHVAPTADQDNHLTNWGDAADTRTGVIAQSLTKANILRGLKQRHVYASEDPNLRVIAHVNGNLMGTIFDATTVPASNSNLNFAVNLTDPDEPLALYVVDVYADVAGGNAVADIIGQFRRDGDGTVDLTDIRYSGGNQYFFLRITQTNQDGENTNLIYTAPVWFEPSRPGPTAPLVSTPTTAFTLNVNEATDEALITNVGSGTINLRNWVLLSVQGSQRFTFGNVSVAPGQSITVLSGPNATARPNTVVWTTSYIWSNAGDPGQLMDTTGRVVAEDL